MPGMQPRPPASPPVEIRLPAPAKINLALTITGRRPDGYHDLDTVFLALPEPHDTLFVAPGPPGSGLALDCPIPGLPPERNIIYKAWDRHAAATGARADLAVRVDKGIPTGAGLGGGSSDAAAMLAHLQTLAGPRALAPDDLNRLAAGLGADVPFFLLRPGQGGGAARAAGIGEVLEPLGLDELGLAGLTLLLACPPEAVNTAWAFAQWDRLQEGPGGFRAFLTTRKQGTTNSAPARTLVLRNDFEAVVFGPHPGLRRIKLELLQAGASACVLSGSGASLYALFRDPHAAARAGEALGRRRVQTFVHTLC
ncbi:MAG: 4-(cytidine 5'-diphospho)-2-C-methyl-D-erythritol kinase [Desulfovibrionaceae bacterium]